jgi:hypothetical protein
MTPAACPRWSKCSAPICPLDPHWYRRRHANGERICLWLREWAKDPSGARWGHALGGEGAVRVAGVAPLILTRWSDIRAKLRAASRKGSKLTSGLALRGWP